MSEIDENTFSYFKGFKIPTAGTKMEFEDELNMEKRKIKIEFSLPKGCYAKIMTKR
ncbi:MAG: hypothetical protein ACUVUG_10320 [Candidatus Aminicenantia bacterium]